MMKETEKKAEETGKSEEKKTEETGNGEEKEEAEGEKRSETTGETEDRDIPEPTGETAGEERPESTGETAGEEQDSEAEKKEGRSRLAKLGRAAFSFLVAAAGICTALWCYRSEETTVWLYAGLTVPLVLGLLAWFPGRLPKAVSALSLIGFPIASFYLLECMTHEPGTICFSVQLLEYAFYLLLFLLCFFLAGGMRFGYLLAEGLVVFVGLANYFVLDFRSSPILPWDLASFGTALDVADNFVFRGSYTLMWILFGFLAMAVLSEKSTLKVSGFRKRAAGAVILVLLLGGYTLAIQTDEVKEVCDIYEMPFTQGYTYKRNGFFVSFLVNAKYLKVEEPEGYSPEAAQAILETASEEGKAETGSEEGETETGSAAAFEENAAEDAPNIIVIMDEAYSDLSVLGDFETSKEVTPFLNQLKQSENCISGHLYVSVLGGNTANTEFEFLTGCSMAFLPTGSVPYQQFIQSEEPSLASLLKSYGYQTLAMHPNTASSWNRSAVYPLLGFDRSLFRSDFTQRKYIRNYVSDASVVRQIISEYENKDEADGPMFCFAVTMQNHGSYSKDYDNFTPKITVTEPELGSLPKVSKYLSLLYYTDQAMEDLIEYFEEQEEKTIIVFFGDHQPTLLENKFFRALLGKDPTDLSWEEQIPRYEVPFYIWANYDIEEASDVQISANYLSTLLMEQAGLPLTDFQQYLKALYEKYPVITAGFCIDAEGNAEEMSAAKENGDLKDYSILQYNRFFDTKNRLAALSR